MLLRVWGRMDTGRSTRDLVMEAASVLFAFEHLWPIQGRWSSGAGSG